MSKSFFSSFAGFNLEEWEMFYYNKGERHKAGN